MIREREKRAKDSAVDHASRIALARFVVLAGVASSILLATVLFVSALVRAVYASIDGIRVIGSAEGQETLVVASVRHADVLLVATALLVIGIGLYSIFISRVEHLPPWLAIRGFEDLKEKLASVVVVALAVDFFTVALEWHGSNDILALGGAIAAVLLGMSAYVLAHRTHDRAGPSAAASHHDVDGEGSHRVHRPGAGESAATGRTHRDRGGSREIPAE